MNHQLVTSEAPIGIFERLQFLAKGFPVEIRPID